VRASIPFESGPVALQLDEAELSWIAQESDALLRLNGIRFLRGEPFEYFYRLARLNDAMTLPIVAPSRRRDAVFLKILYAIWNITVDDELDRVGTSAGLDASLAFLMATPAERATLEGGACAVLRRIAEVAPCCCLSRSEPVGFDLWEVAHGFCYEFLINRNPAQATHFEYRRYSAMTASIKIMLDFDCLCAARPLDVSEYRILRRAYDELSSAIKLASDVGTLRREVYEENNMSYLRILAEERTDSGESPKNAVMTGALRFREEVVQMAWGHLGIARELSAAIRGIDLSGVLGAVAGIVEIYASGVDPFFESISP